MKIFSKNKTSVQDTVRRLIVITGCAGSGKTTVGRELAKQLGYAYIDKDTVTREYTDYILTRLGSFNGDRESDLYTNEILGIEYSVTFKVCREILSYGCNVVLTIPFIRQITDYSKWEEIRQNARIKPDVVVKFIWIEHNINAEKKNIKNRAAARDRYKLAHWDEYEEGLEGIEPAPEFDAYRYVNDCDVNLSDTLEEVKAWINK